MKLRLFVFFFGLSAATFVGAQGLRIIPNGTGSQVSIYLPRPLPSGYGFEVYRTTANGEEKKLTQAPIRATQTGDEFQAKLGAEYETIRQNLDEATAAGVWLRLKGNRTQAALYGFLYPNVAQALGQLFIDEAPATGQSSYRITFVNAMNQVQKEELTGRIFNRPWIPSAPTQATASALDRTVSVTWKYPKNEPEDGTNRDYVVQFKVYRKVGNEARFQQVNASVLLRTDNQMDYTFQDIAPALNVQVQYYVVAHTIVGTPSPQSNLATLSIQDNAAPLEINEVKAISSVAGDMVTITFPVGIDATLKGYALYRSEEIEEGFTRINASLIPPLQNTYQDKTVLSGKTYYYRLTMLDQANNESKRSNPAMVKVSDITPPKGVANLKATLSADKNIQLNWTAPAQAYDFKTYLVLRRLHKTRLAYDQLNTADFAGSSFTDSQWAAGRLDEGRDYEYAVLGMDKNSNFSDTSYVVVSLPDKTPPPAPSQFTADGSSGRYAILAWSTAMARDVAGYTLMRQEGQGSPVLVGRYDKETLQVRDEAIEMGKSYTYLLSAKDERGLESKVISTTLDFRDPTPPRAVQVLQATRQGNQVKLRWEAVTASDLKGYRIYRTTGTLSGVYQKLGEVGATQTEWTDPAAPSGAVYYQVRAFDTSNNESKPSPAARD